MIRNLVLTIALFFSLQSFAVISTSIAGGIWNNAANWNNGIPGVGDTAIVAHNITANIFPTVQALVILNGGFLTTNSQFLVNDFCDIQAGGTVANNGLFRVRGNYFLNGTHSGTGIIRLTGLGGLLSGTGVCNNTNKISITNSSRTIPASSTLDCSAMKIALFNGLTVTNNGTISIGELKGQATGETWINTANSQLLIFDQIRSGLILDASANPNLVSYGHSNNITTTLISTLTGEYHDLEVIGNGRRELESSITINNNLTIGGTAIMDVDDGIAVYDVTILGDWNNTGGSFDPSIGSVTFAGTSNQNLSVTSGSESFYNLNFVNGGTLTQTGDITIINDLTFTSTYDLNGSTTQLLGDFLNNGTFASNGGTVSMSGFSSQDIVNSTTFDNLTINNGLGVEVLTGFTTVMGTLSLDNGLFSTNDSLIIGSNSTTTGRIGEVTGGSITGNVTVERYFDPLAQGWVMLGAPTNGLTLADWKDDFFMTGFPGSDYPTYPFNNVQFYDETQLGHKDIGLNGATNITDAVSIGSGIRGFMNSLPMTIESTGTVHTGNFNFGITYTNSGSTLDDGWNLVGNPYASAIDWDGSGWTKTNVNNAIYVWDGSLGLYNSYINGVGVNGGSNIIPSTQSFWIQTNGTSPTLTITESDKSVGNGTFKSSDNQSVFNLYVVNGDYQDQIAIVVNEDATMMYDNDYDALKFYTPNTYIPNIASISDDNVELAINAIPVYDADTSIPIKVVAEAGTHTIKTDADLDLLPTSCAFLEDLVTGDQIAIVPNMEHDFDWSGTNMVSPRFMIHFTAPAQMDVSDLSCYDSNDGNATVTGTASGPWNYTWYDDMGNVIQETLNSSGPDAINDLSPGYYSVVVEGGNNCGNNLLEFEILNVAPTSFVLSGGNVDDCNSSENGTIGFNVSSANEGMTWNIELVDSQNNVVYELSNGEGDISISNLSADEYTLTVSNDCDMFVENLDLHDPSAVVADFSPLETVINIAEGEYLEVNNNSLNSDTYLWDFGDGNQSSEFEPQHTYSEIGFYTVSLHASNTSCQESIEIEIEVIDQPVGIDDLDGSDFNMFIDGNSQLVIESDFNISNPVRIEIINYIGQQVYSATINNFNGFERIQMSELSKSIYLVSLISNGETLFTKKVVY